MPASFYADVSDASGANERDRERQAFDHGIGLMKAAAGGGGDASEAAARYMQDLWGFLIRDLASPANDLPDELRANLISIGLWVMRETDAIVGGAKADWTPLIEINATVREGLAA